MSLEKMMPNPLNTDERAQLQDLVRRHSINYEVFPEYQMVNGTRTQIGYTVELFGTWEPGKGKLSPENPATRQTYADLRRLAEHLLPEASPDARVNILPFDQALHESERRELRPEVELVLRISHKGMFDHPVDEPETSSLKAIEQKLGELGVGRGS